MKTNLFFLSGNFYGILMLLFLLNACDQGEYYSPTENANRSIEHDKAIIEAMGFDTTSLIDVGDFYIVEGDVMFNKEDLNSYVQTKQAHYIHLINSDYQSSITVGVDASIPTSGEGNWRTEVQQAISVWNSVNRCTINMTYTTLPNPDILVRSDNGSLPDGIPASAFYPQGNGKPGSTVRINTDFGTVPSIEKKFIMTHELGHCLGLGHTDWQTDSASNSGIFNIPNTPTIDANSIMNSHYYRNNVPTALSNYDKVAIVTLYHHPFTGSLLNFPLTVPLPNGAETATISVQSNQSNLTYYWSTSGALSSLSQGQGTSSYTVYPDSPSTFAVSVTLTNPYGEKLYVYRSIDGTAYSQYSYGL
jgi:hypothetical protein